MSELSRRIINALLRVSVDPGHGGPFYEYRIDSEEDGYRVTLRISGPPARPGGSPSPPSPPSRTPRQFPASAESRPERSSVTEVLVKGRHQAEAFLGKLSDDFDVYGLRDLEPAYPFLHPTFYSFAFRDSAGGSHSFEYRIECSNHLGERYKELIREFDDFFESGRVFDKFTRLRRPAI